MINMIASPQVNLKETGKMGAAQQPSCSEVSRDDFFSLLVRLSSMAQERGTPSLSGSGKSCELLSSEILAGLQDETDIEAASELLAALGLIDPQYYATILQLPDDVSRNADSICDAVTFNGAAGRLQPILPEAAVAANPPQMATIPEQSLQSDDMLLSENGQAMTADNSDSKLNQTSVLIQPKSLTEFDQLSVSMNAAPQAEPGGDIGLLEARQYQNVLQQVKQQLQDKQQEALKVNSSGNKEEPQVEALQKKLQDGQVDRNLSWYGGAYPNEGLKQPEIIFNNQLNEIRANEKTLLEQVTEGISQGLTDKENTFIIKLNPESLGEITVRLVQEQQRVSLSITSASEETAKLLNSQLSVLSEALKPYNAQVHTVTSQSWASDAANEQAFQNSLPGYQQQQSQEFRHNLRSGYAGIGSAAAELNDETIPADPQRPLYSQGLDCYI